MCGLCLPHCPTYRKTGDENESPRGRIALMRALAEGDLPLSPRLENHLAQCTACSACERVCPSYVGYSEMLTATRAAIAERHAGSWVRRGVQRFVLNGLLHARGLQLMKTLLRAYQASGLQGWLRQGRWLHRLRLAPWEYLLPDLASPRHHTAPARPLTPTRGKVALFTGCVASVLDAGTLQAATRVLTRLGYEVVQPDNQTCCGALPLHAGDMSGACDRMRRNLQAFDDPALQAIIGVASGCTALLTQYPQYLTGDKDNPGATEFSRRVRDINRFLVEAPWPDDLTLASLDKTIAVQDPCTLRNVLRGQEHVYTLLGRIPQARIVPLPENQFCCGGAGAYMLTQPAMAGRLRDDKLTPLQQLAPDILATSNVGCALHVGAGMRSLGMGAEVVHPVSLIDRQWPD